ncbi:uncharacterized protein HMPREF1541_01842 [Cyphellophora europaea CBS 101466]|uniref:GST N-terminal domain-containing protein n=1 Tax=Cyphellophora europaea (strain CBS 101466) TaxID=1220924 RepID=W2S271_CYPE1|nr:uncharacterized protein HMPREF1541_01842 [Cyphellophora europaea CBS 101466]ETN42685.1 hypothetical protein HMPREF1541_01842 [Cyphellophora europaea CBS 101466]
MPPPRSALPVVLFGYDSSAFTQKARMSLRLKQIPYTFVIVPSMMPRPILKDNFNITYRKIPVVMIGKETYIDTSCICEALEQRFPLSQGYGTLYPPVSGGGPQRSLIRALASYWVDRPLFRMTCGIMPASIWRSPFGIDRAGLIGHKLDPDKLERKVPQNMSGLDMHLSLLESLLAESGGKQAWVLDTPQPSLADISFYYQLHWGRNIASGYGAENLTAGGVEEGGEEGADIVLNSDRYPLVEAWYSRTQKYFGDLPLRETRVEQGDSEGLAKITSTIEQTRLDPEIPLLTTAAPPHRELDARNGLSPGVRVSIAPDDTGMNDPSFGTLLATSPEEIVIAPEDIESRRVDLRLHFPRIGFRVRPLTKAAL